MRQLVLKLQTGRTRWKIPLDGLIMIDGSVAHLFWQLRNECLTHPKTTGRERVSNRSIGALKKTKSIKSCPLWSSLSSIPSSWNCSINAKRYILHRSNECHSSNFSNNYFHTYIKCWAASSGSCTRDSRWQMASNRCIIVRSSVTRDQHKSVQLPQLITPFNYSFFFSNLVE